MVQPCHGVCVLLVYVNVSLSLAVLLDDSATPSINDVPFVPVVTAAYIFQSACCFRLCTYTIGRLAPWMRHNYMLFVNTVYNIDGHSGTPYRIDAIDLMINAICHRANRQVIFFPRHSTSPTEAPKAPRRTGPRDPSARRW